MTLSDGDVAVASYQTITRFDSIGGAVVWSLDLATIPLGNASEPQTRSINGFVLVDLDRLIVVVSLRPTSCVPSFCVASAHVLAVNATAGTVSAGEATVGSYVVSDQSVDDVHVVLAPELRFFVQFQALIGHDTQVSVGTLFAYDCATLNLLWTTSNLSSRYPVLASSFVVAIALDSSVQTHVAVWKLLDSATGAPLQLFVSVPVNLSACVLPSVHGEVRLVCASATIITAFRFADPEVIWTVEAPSNSSAELPQLSWLSSHSPPAILVANSNAMQVRNLDTGAVIVASPTEGCCQDHAKVFPLLDVVIRLYDSGRISAYSIDNGLHLWSVNSQLTTSTSAFAEAGRLLFAVDDDMMAAFRVGKSASVVTVTAVSHVDSLVLFLECGPPCLHGKCNQTGSCVCQSGYIGVACDSCSGEQPVRCTMGTCAGVANRTQCSGCRYGYVGDDCTIECPNGHEFPCGGPGHGTCLRSVSGGYCECNATSVWVGANCTQMCPGAPSNTCGGRSNGQCESRTASCSCVASSYLSSIDGLCYPCPPDSGTLYPNVTNITACVRCPAGRWGSDPRSCQSCLSTGCSGGVTCAPGYTGESCGLCVAGWYQQIDSTINLVTCHTCSSASAIVVLIVVVTLGFATLLLLWLQSKPLIQRVCIPLKIGYVYLQGESSVLLCVLDFVA